MTTQGVMTQAAKLAMSSTGNTASKSKQTSNDFSLYIGKSMNSSQDNTGKIAVATTKKASTKAPDNNDNTSENDSDAPVNKTNAVQTDNSAKQVKTKGIEQNAKTQPDSTKAIEDNSTVTDDTDEVQMDEQTADQLMQMLQSVLQAVMNGLQLTPQELDQQLNNQGMTAVDLLNSDNLQQFILQCNGETNIVAALTNENLADTINQLLDTVNNLKADYNSGLTDEQLQALLKQAEALKDSIMDTVTVTSGNDDKKVVSNEPVNQAAVSDATNKVHNEDNNNSTKSASDTNVVKTETVTVGTEKADTPANSNSDSSSHKDLNTKDEFQNFVDNLVKATQNVPTDFSDDLNRVSNLREIANQIIDSIKVTVSSDKTSMELQLNPESLGKVNLSVHSRDGIMTAHFVVQNELSKEAIESQIQTLRDTLHEQGIKVDAIEVTVASNAFDQNSNQASENQQETKKSNSGKQISLDEALNMTDDSDVESVQKDSTGIRGSLVDYTA